MHPMLSALSLALALFVCAATAHDLRAELQALAPSGEIMRLVYQKGGPPNQDNGYGDANRGNPNVGIYTVTSEDGIIRKIYPSGAATGNYHCVNITYDGNRVVFYDFDANQVVVISYTTGAELKRFNAPFMYDYWFNASDNTEWVITSNNSTVTRYNINAANPTPVTILSSLNGYCGVSDARTLSISDDGQKLLLCRNDRAALLTLSSGNIVNGKAGCWYMMRSGKNSAGLVEFSQNADLGHMGPTIINENGVTVLNVHVSDSLNKWLSRPGNSAYDVPGCNVPNCAHCVDGLRWLRNRNYFSVIAQAVKIGPLLWRLPDNKWTYIEEGLNCEYAGDLDGITASSFTDVIQHGLRPAPSAQRTSLTVRRYATDGRLLPQSAASGQSYKGIAIHQQANGAVIRICK